MKKRGPKEHSPTDKDREMVKMMSIAGVPQNDICQVLKISRPTLEKHYRKELDSAQLEAVAYATNRLMQQVRDGNLSAIIFFLKTRGRGQFNERIDMSAELKLPTIKINVIKKSDD